MLKKNQIQHVFKIGWKNTEKTKHETKFNKKPHPYITKLWSKSERRNHYKSPSNRVHIFNSQLPHSSNDPPACESYTVDYTIKHILTECQITEDFKNKLPYTTTRRSTTDFQLNININNFLKKTELLI